jgi:hypothetical protein
MFDQTTTVPTPRWIRALVWLCLPLVGAALLYAAVRVVWWLPLPGPLGVIRDLPGTVASIVAAALGAILGLVLAGLVDRESLTVRITAAEVVLSRPGTTRVVPRRAVAVAFPDRDNLVLLGPTGREEAREPCHLGAGRLRAAFAANGISWSDGDPYAGTYRRWVPDLPDLPATAHALLAARQKAIDARDESDQRELRTELAHLGYVLRDERKRQYWRRADGP